MKKSLKSIVRAISPFTKKKSDLSADGGVEHDQFTWDLSVVDVKQALKIFYKKYNPEKAFIVSEILIKYEGSEVLLLQQLCQRYNISQDEMQGYLDQCPLHSPSASVPRKSVARRPSINSNSNSRSEARPAEPAAQEARRDQQQMHWDLEGVDVGAALRALYKKHNPQKMPNLAAIQNKSDDEITSVLRQLCKRHALTEADMQDFLDQSPADRPSFIDELDNDLPAEPVKRRPTRASMSPQQPLPPTVDPFPRPMPPAPPAPPTLRAPAAPAPPPKAYTRSSIAPPMAPPPPPPPQMVEQSLTASLFQAPRPDEQEFTEQDEEISITPTGSSKDSGGTPKKRIAPTYFRDGKRFTLSPMMEEMKTNPHVSRAYQMANAGELERKDEEISQLQSELEAARQQAEELSNTIQQTAADQYKKARKDSVQGQNQQLALFKAQQKIDSLQGMVQGLRDEVKESEVHYDALMDVVQAKSTEIEDLGKKISSLQAGMKRLQIDKSDLLQLLNILSSAPMAAKNVLEAYFAKLAASSPKDAFLADKVVKAKDQLMGDRVDHLLQWKRQQEADNTESKEEADMMLDVDSDDERDLPEDQEHDEESKSEDSEAALRREEEEDERKQQQDASLKRLTPGERKIYEGLRLHKASAEYKARSAASSRSPSPRRPVDEDASSFLSRGKGLPSVTSSEVDEDEALPEDDLLSEQYELAKKFYQHQRSQFKISEKIARSNLSLQEQQTDRAIKVTQQRVRNSPPKRPPTAEKGIAKEMEGRLQRLMSSSRGSTNGDDRQDSIQQGPAPSSTNDWVECLDPRSRKKYYYNAKLKKSTWVQPAELAKEKSSDAQDAAAEQETKSSAISIRSQSPLSLRMLETRNGGALKSWQADTAGSAGRSLQPSPAPSARNSESNSRATSTGSATSRRSNQSAQSGWVTAVDPKTQRKYWYNRYGILPHHFILLLAHLLAGIPKSAPGGSLWT